MKRSEFAKSIRSEIIEILSEEESAEDIKAKASAQAELNAELEKTKELTKESLNPEVTKAVDRFIKAMTKRYDYSEQDAVFAIQAALKQREFDKPADIPGFEGTMGALDSLSIREEGEDVIDENALGMTDSRLSSDQHKDLDYAVRGDSAYTFGNDPYADDQLRYKYARKMGFLEENARDKAAMMFDKMKVGATIKTSKGEFKKVNDKYFEIVGKPGRKFTAKQMTFIKEKLGLTEEFDAEEKEVKVDPDDSVAQIANKMSETACINEICK